MLVKHWQKGASRRLTWADAITPECESRPANERTFSPKKDPKTVTAVSSDLKRALAIRWPNINVRDRIELFSDEIGWSFTRSRDIYYADQRVSFRALEQDEINSWFDHSGKGETA